MRILLSFCLLSLLAPASRAAEFFCPLGEPVSAPIGDGVVMHTCMWQKNPGQVVRTGPMQLVRHDTLILELRTNFDGKLHGRFRSWDDDGVLTDEGNYHNGLKQGAWLETDADGKRLEVHYRDGVAVIPWSDD